MASKKTVVHIIDSLGRGGAETLLIGIVSSLTLFEHIIISLKPTNEFEKELQGVKVYFLDFKWYHSIPGTVLKVKEIISLNQVDVVHANLYWSIIVSRIATPKKIKLVNSYHALIYGPEGANYPVYAKWLDKFTYRKSTVTLCVSKGVKNNIAKHVGINGNVSILHNYIEDIFFDNYRPAKAVGNTLKLVAVGNLKEDKNYGLLIDAFSKLRNDLQSRISLDIYGKGGLLSSLQKQCVEKNVSKIFFKGSVANVASLLPSYDGFIISSRTEGFGIAVAEAMAVGLPVIVSDIPVLREVTGGYALFFNSDEAISLCRTLESVFDNKDLLVAMAANGHSHSYNYKKHLYMKKLTEYYS